VGRPTIEEDVHVGPGATLVGPITIGARSKIMAGAFVRVSVPPDSLVSSPDPVVGTRVQARAQRPPARVVARARVEAQGEALALLVGAALASLPGCPKSALERRARELSASTSSPSPPAAQRARSRSRKPIYDGALREQVGRLRVGEARGGKGPGPARVDFSKYGGWIIAKPGLPAEGGSFRGRNVSREDASRRGGVPRGARGDDRLVDLSSRIKLSADERRDVGDGWSEVVIPMSDSRSRRRCRSTASCSAHFGTCPPAGCELDKLALLAGTSRRRPTPARRSIPPRRAPIALTVDCRALAKRIDPRIYGIAYDAQRGVDDAPAWALGADDPEVGRQPDVALQLGARQRLEHGERLVLRERQRQPRTPTS
jgi:hypothetical protein